MSELYNKSLLKLELDQVLELLAECAGSQEGKAACRNLYPNSDLEDVKLMLDQTTAASDLCTKKGNPGFSEVRDVSASLERADRGGSLRRTYPQDSGRSSGEHVPCGGNLPCTWSTCRQVRQDRQIAL